MADLFDQYGIEDAPAPAKSGRGKPSGGDLFDQFGVEADAAAPQQAVEPDGPAPNGFSNAMRNAGERGSTLLGNLIQGVGTVVREGNQQFEDLTGMEVRRPALPFLPDELASSETLTNAGQAVEDVDLGYRPNYTIDRALDEPSVGTVLGAVGEQGPAALADMLGLAVNLPGYALSRNQEIAEARAANNGRKGDQPTGSEFMAATPATAGSLALDRFSLGRALKGSPGSEIVSSGRDVAVEGLKGGGREAVTEGVQENIEYAGETLGTKTDWEGETAFRRGAGGAIIGGPVGGGVSAVAARLRMSPEQVQAEADALGITPAEVERLYDEGLGATDVNDIIAANTGTDRAPVTDQNQSPESRQREAARRKGVERELGEALSGTDVLRRDDIDGFDDDGNPLYREGAQPARDPRGRQADPSTFGAQRAANRVADELGLTLPGDRLDLAARDIADGADPVEAVRSYAPESGDRAFRIAEIRRRRRDADLDKRNPPFEEGRPERDYTAGAGPEADLTPRARQDLEARARRPQSGVGENQPGQPRDAVDRISTNQPDSFRGEVIPGERPQPNNGPQPGRQGDTFDNNYDQDSLGRQEPEPETESGVRPGARPLEAIRRDGETPEQAQARADAQAGRTQTAIERQRQDSRQITGQSEQTASRAEAFDWSKGAERSESDSDIEVSWPTDDLEAGVPPSMVVTADGDAPGYVMAETGSDGRSVQVTEAVVDTPNQGTGTRLYRGIIDFADRRGLAFESDSQLSPASQAMYRRLEREGYQVETVNPPRDGDDGWVVADGPIYRVRPESEQTAQTEPEQPADNSRADQKAERQAERDADARRAEEKRTQAEADRNRKAALDRQRSGKTEASKAADLLPQIDDAIENPTDAEFVEFKTKTGTFRVKNDTKRLQDFRKRMAATDKSRTTRPSQKKTPQRGSKAAVQEAVMEGDTEFAYELAKTAGVDVVFGTNGKGEAILYSPQSAQKIAGVDAVVIRDKNGWGVLIPETGLTLSSREKTKNAAVKEARDAAARVGEAKLRQTVKDRKIEGGQAELERKFREQIGRDRPAGNAKPKSKAEPKPEADSKPDKPSPEQLVSELKALGRKGTVKDLIEIALRAGYTRHEPILKALQKNRRVDPDMPVRLSGRKSQSRGSYSQKTDDSDRSVSINTNYLDRLLRGEVPGRTRADAPEAISEVITHELVHAATVRAMYSNFSPEVNAEGAAIRKALRAWVDANPKAYADLNKQARLGIDQVLTNARELPSWGLTSPEFQNFLATVDGSGKSDSLFSQFVELVKKAIGLDTNDTSMLADVIRVSEKWMDVDQSVPNGRSRLTNALAEADLGPDGITYLTDNLPDETKVSISRRAAEAVGGKESDWREFPETAEKFGQNIRDAAGGVTGSGRASKRSLLTDMFRSVLASTDGNMRVLAGKFDSPTMKSIADMFHATAGRGDGVTETFDEAVAARLSTRLSEVDKLTDFMKKNKLKSEDVIAKVENRRAPRKGKLGEAANMLDKFVKEELRYMRESGVEVGEVRDGYFPRELDRALVTRKKGEFVKAAAEAYKKAAAETGESISKADAQARAEAYWENTVFGDSGTPGYEAPSGTGTDFTNSRVFSKAAAKELEQFYVRDIDAVLGGYTQRAVRRAEIAKRFGDRWSKWSELEDKMKAEDPDTQNVFGDLRALAAVSAGVQRGSRSDGIQHGLSMLRTWTTLGALEKASLASMGELVLAPMRGATGNPIHDMTVAMNNIGGHIWNAMRGLVGNGSSKDLKAAYEFAQDLGAIAGHGSNHLMAARFAGGDPVGQGQSKAMSAFFRRTLLEQLTNYTRVTTLKNARVFVRRLAHNMENGKGTKDAFFLRELGVPKGREAEFAKMVRSFGDQYPTFEQLNSKGELGKFYKTAMSRFTDQTVMRPSNSTRPKWASSPLGAVVFQLQSFGYAFQKNVINRYARIGSNTLTGKDMSRLEAAAVTLSMTGSAGMLVGFQAMLSELRREVYDREDREFTNQARLEEALSRAGFFGAADPYIQTITGVRYNRPVISSLSGPSIGGLAEAGQTIMEGFMSDNATNTAERRAWEAVYGWFAEPAMQLALTPIPFSAATAFTSTYAIPAGRDLFVDAVAGERQSNRKPTPITGMFEDNDSGGGQVRSRTQSRGSTGRLQGRESVGR